MWSEPTQTLVFSVRYLPLPDVTIPYLTLPYFNRRAARIKREQAGEDPKVERTYEEIELRAQDIYDNFVVMSAATQVNLKAHVASGKFQPLFNHFSTNFTTTVFVVLLLSSNLPLLPITHSLHSSFLSQTSKTRLRRRLLKVRRSTRQRRRSSTS
jgi:hypothetical protein